MSFEIRERDLLARIGRLETKSGRVETPVLLPVVNPAVQPIAPKDMREEFGCEALITNAYIVKKHFEEEPTRKGIHKLLDFDGVVMTDSGAYQILVYGKIEESPEEIVRYQEEIDTDIATILDVPTGWKASRDHARETVEETLRRAKKLGALKTREDILWVGPVQGGQHLDLVAFSAREMGKLPFEIHALGSPTLVMQQYLFDTLVEMILTAKQNLPPERPLHLFGAGHPFMFALAVALGCDLFDSAAYAIYAREDRYMTGRGTIKLSKLEYLPCSCPVCVKNDPKSLVEASKAERERLLAKHNLHVCFEELRMIKQSITEGTLWEHLELRAHGHPALFQALKKLKKYEDYIERRSPTTKRSGLFFFGSQDLVRPEVVRHRKRLFERYSPPEKAKTLILFPQTKTKPFHKSKEQRTLSKVLQKELKDNVESLHVCTYAAPFGVVPTELDEVYPLSQHEIATPLDTETVEYVAEQVANYIEKTNYEKVVLLEDEAWKGKIKVACQQACGRKGVPLIFFEVQKELNKRTLEGLIANLKSALLK